MPPSPTIVLVAGSWHQGKCYERVTRILEEQYKLKCISITLPSTMGDPAAEFKGDVDAVRVAITGETSQGCDVVVIAHSFGGMVGNSAIKGLTRSREPKENSDGGRVIGLILIASGFTFTGLAFMDLFLGMPPPAWKINKETGFADLVASPREFFYHDLSAEDAAYWVSQLGSQSLKALFEGGEYAYAGWLDVPTWYIGTIEDRGLPILVQRMQIGMARAMGASVVHRELCSSHSPFLSMPKECVKIIAEAVASFTSQPVVEILQQRLVQSTKSVRILVPRVSLLAPSTWFRYGAPLIIGRFLGQCIRIFSWLRRLRTPAT